MRHLRPDALFPRLATLALPIFLAAACGSSGTGDTGSGGSGAEGGTTGTGGSATGGTTGTGGTLATGGTMGTGGMIATGGTKGTGGATGTGGASATGGTTGTGGATGTGGGGGAPCGPGSCNGCCAADGLCIHNPSAQQCGSHGGACTACGGCQTCSNGACAIDPASQWTIVAVSAQVAMSPPGGGTWDPPKGDEGGTAPDLFCEYENPSGDVSSTTAGVTSTLTDVFTADWNQTITPVGVTVSASALMASKPAWRIWVGDEDCGGGPGSCGGSGQTACSYQRPVSAASLQSGGLTVDDVQSCLSLELQFVCQTPTMVTP